jgi:hypothetical protein
LFGLSFSFSQACLGCDISSSKIPFYDCIIIKSKNQQSHLQQKKEAKEKKKKKVFNKVRNIMNRIHTSHTTMQYLTEASFSLSNFLNTS